MFTHEAALRERLAAIPDLQILVARVGQKRIVTSTGCWEFSGGHSIKGYPQLSLGWYPEVRRGVYAKLHRLALALSQGLDYFDDWTTLHTCPGEDNPGCWNPDHLRTGTNADNLRDAMQRGQRPGALLLSDRHDEIVGWLNAGVGTVEISQRLGCAPCTVSNFKRRFGIGSDARYKG